MKQRGSTIRKVIVALLFALALPCRADGPTREYQVKAAFIYNFTQFVQWPQNAFGSQNSPLVVAVVGDDPFDGALRDIMAQKTAYGHPITVLNFSSAGDIQKCHILFVPSSQDSSVKDIFARLDKQPVLVVGETDEFMADGGAIELFLEDGKMRFGIDPDVLDADGLRASAKLMKLARIYRR
jgi:hypothetical protein